MHELSSPILGKRKKKETYVRRPKFKREQELKIGPNVPLPRVSRSFDDLFCCRLNWLKFICISVQHSTEVVQTSDDVLYKVVSKKGGPTSEDWTYKAEENKAIYGRKTAMKIPESDKGGGRCGYFAIYNLLHSIPDVVRVIHVSIYVVILVSLILL